MAGEPPEPKPPEPKPPAPEPKPPEPKPEPEAKPEAQRDEPQYVECPDCDALMRPEKLGGHQFKTHGKDRRQTPEDTEGGDDKDKSKRKPPQSGPPKNTPAKDGGERTPEGKKSRWSEVRGGWS